MQPAGRVAEIYRKMVHLLLSFLLLLPFIVHLPWPLTIQNYYSLGLFMAAFLNSLVARRVKVLHELEEARENIESLISKAWAEIKQPLFIIEHTLSKLQELIASQISLLERDYEKREGYVGLLYGMIGATLSILVAPGTTIYGILALAIVDTIPALHDLLFSSSKKSLRGSTLALVAYFFVLIALGAPLIRSLLLSIIACITEYISPEDNLTVPLVSTLAACYLGLPPRNPA